DVGKLQFLTGISEKAGQQEYGFAGYGDAGIFKKERHADCPVAVLRDQVAKEIEDGLPHSLVSGCSIHLNARAVTKACSPRRHRDPEKRLLEIGIPACRRRYPGCLPVMVGEFALDSLRAGLVDGQGTLQKFEQRRVELFGRLFVGEMSDARIDDHFAML